jgi:hypothetical protein
MIYNQLGVECDMLIRKQQGALGLEANDDARWANYRHRIGSNDG